MRFAHLSDSHLGHRQYGLLERENDFYDVFARNIDKIIEKDVDFVIHSGDLFDNNRPSTEALVAFQKALLRLNEAKIPIYAIAGNDDTILRKGAMPPQVLFRDIGLKLISPDRPYYQEGAVLICGLPYVANSQKSVLIDRYNQLSRLAEKSIKSILVSHQGIQKYMPDETAEIELSDLPKNFDYYAMGHIHNYIEEDYGKGKLVYPGSMEIWRANESNDNYRQFGKGFCVVDLSYDTPQVERVTIDLPREFYSEIIDYDKFHERLYRIKEEIRELDNKPMLDLTVVGGDFDSSKLYELIQETIGDDVLNLRPSFKPEKILKQEIELGKNKILDPRSLVYNQAKEEYGKDEVGRLSIDLLDNLSVNKIEEAKHFSDVFYKENYYDDEAKDDLDSTNESGSSSDSIGLDNVSGSSSDSIGLDNVSGSSSADNSDLIHNDDNEENNSNNLDEYLNRNLEDSSKKDVEKGSNMKKTKEISLDNF